MSLQQHKDARLSGFDGPIFPPATNQLNVAQDKAHLNGSLLSEAGGKVQGYRAREWTRTSDGYRWFWSLHFRCKGGEVAILFPRAQDWEKADGSQSDRSIAIYTRGHVDEKDANSVCEKVAAAILEIAAEREAA